MRPAGLAPCLRFTTESLPFNSLAKVLPTPTKGMLFHVVGTSKSMFFPTGFITKLSFLVTIAECCRVLQSEGTLSKGQDRLLR